MRALHCPYCGLRCLSFWAKASLGPLRKKPCDSCGQFVGVAWLPSSLLLLLSSFTVFFGGLLAVIFFSPMPPGVLFLPFVLGALAGAVPVLWLYYRFVPLVRRPPDNSLQSNPYSAPD